MVKVYKLHPASLYFVVICIIFTLSMILVGKSIHNKAMYYLALFITPFMIIGFILALLTEIEINDKEIWGHCKYLPIRGKRIKWEDIKYIDDDHYLFGHVFRLFSSVNFEGNFIQKWKDTGNALRFPNFFKNYDGLLREILVRCNPGTKVDEIVLHKADMTWEQVEIERRKRWLGKPTEEVKPTQN